MALRSIVLKNFVLVRQIDLALADGFSVLTGETGAGKSILIDALQLALGARADAGLVREGASRTEVSAEFDDTPQAAAWLQAAGFEQQDPLLLRRVVDAQGKSRAWINGSAATAAQLRELADLLVDIYGQHAWQSLMRPEAMRQLLDGYAAIDTRALQQAWQQWQQARKRLAQAHQTQEQLHLQHERLSWQLAEVAKLAPQADEWDDLNARHTRLSNRQSLQQAAQSALDALETEPMGASSQLSKALGALDSHRAIEPQFEAAASILRTAQAELTDVAHTLRSYLRQDGGDEHELADLDGRVALWLSLSKRFRLHPRELHDAWQGWQQQLAAIEQQADLEALTQQVQQARQDWQQQAQRVGDLRQRAAPALARAVTQIMQTLGMKGGRLDIVLQPLAEPAAAGMESVEFLVAAHAKATPRPIQKVASGGELSRISLAIAVTTSQIGTAPTLVFDEVDAGIGGGVADAVGQLMRQLGLHRQVLAITHLPQVAACAHHHWVVEKRQQADGVASLIRAAADGDARAQEVARMLGGDVPTLTSLSHAREMLTNANQPRQGEKPS